MRSQVNGRAVFASTVPVTILKFHLNTIRMLRTRGYDDVRLVSSPGSAMDEAVRLTGTRGHALPMSRSMSPFADVLALARWITILVKLRPGLVIAGTPKCALLALVAARITRVPRRVYLCGGLRLEGELGWRRRLLASMERIAMASATEVVVNSCSLSEEVLAARLVQPSKLRQTHPGSSHGVDSDHFSPRAPDLTLMRSFGLDAELPVVGMVGRLTRDKGIDTLISAACALQARGDRVALLLVGPHNEPDSEKYLRRLRNSGLNVVLVGATADVRPYFAMMDIHILPSLREGFPNVVLEAAAMGIPTVTTTATGCRDSVLDGETGVLVPTGDGEALARAIARLLDDDEERTRFGLNARRWVVQAFQPEQIAAQIVDDHDISVLGVSP